MCVEETSLGVEFVGGETPRFTYGNLINYEFCKPHSFIGLNSARFSELADFQAKGRRSTVEKLVTTSKQQQQQQQKQRQRENVLINLPVKIPICN